MTTATGHIDSQSVGDPGRFSSVEHLEQRLAAGPVGPTDSGRVALLVRRGNGGRRETLDRIRMTADAGVPGDTWGRRPHRTSDGQIAVMQRDVAELIANGQPLLLFGDNLFLDLDLSSGNLPFGTRLRVGRAILEVTPKAHNGCHKFEARFGSEARRFVNMPELRHRNLRGIYMRVVEDGDVALGDAVEVIARTGFAPHA